MASGPQFHMYSAPETHIHLWTSYLHRLASALVLQGLGLLGVVFVNLVSFAGSHGCCIMPACLPFPCEQPSRHLYPTACSRADDAVPFLS